MNKYIIDYDDNATSVLNVQTGEYVATINNYSIVNGLRGNEQAELLCKTLNSANEPSIQTCKLNSQVQS
jgi:hypothetical protein